MAQFLDKTKQKNRSDFQIFQALMATDGSDFKGRQLSVEISRPPPRKPGGPTLQSGPSLGSGLSEGSRGKGRSQLSFVPRAVASSSPATSNGSNGTTQKSEGAGGQPKSNADFRSMLLGKKWKPKPLNHTNLKTSEAWLLTSWRMSTNMGKKIYDM